jgi:DNA-binding NtrC family response regulator
MSRLKREDRSLLEQVAAIAVMNPFSEERDAADRSIAGGHLAPRSLLLLQELMDKVERHVLRLREEIGRADLLNAFSEDDRTLVGKVLLFHEFHARILHFDEFIAAQERAFDLLAPPFAAECLRTLETWGFSSDEASDYFALMYQLRRAYYFIRSALQGESTRILELRSQLWNSIFSHDSEFFESTLRGRMENFSILILGETGTGKSAAARAIGLSQYIPWERSKRRFAYHPSTLFCPINLVEYPETLLESALFGHKKGSFTGAISDHAGLFARTNENSLVFLDEIGEASPAIQVKLLRVLQERMFTPVGEETARPFRGRIVAATNLTIAELTHGKRMRLDLFFRLCTDVIEFPSLRLLTRENPEELARVVDVIAERTLGAPVSKRRRGEVVEKIRVAVGEDHAWPGNIRELEQRVRQILLTGKTTLPKLDLVTLPGADAGGGGLEALLVKAAESGLDADGILQRYCVALYEKERSYESVARIARLDWRTVRKLCQREGR